MLLKGEYQRGREEEKSEMDRARKKKEGEMEQKAGTTRTSKNHEVAPVVLCLGWRAFSMADSATVRSRGG